MCLNLCIQSHLSYSPPVISKSNPPKSADKGKEGKVPHLSRGFGSFRVSGQKLDWTPTVFEVRGLVGSPPLHLHHLPTNFAKSPLVSPFSSTPYVACTCCACTSCVPLVKYTMEVEKFRRCYVTGSRCRPALSRNLDNGLIL